MICSSKLPISRESEVIPMKCKCGGFAITICVDCDKWICGECGHPELYPCPLCCDCYEIRELELKELGLDR